MVTEDNEWKIAYRTWESGTLVTRAPKTRATSKFQS